MRTSPLPSLRQPGPLRGWKQSAGTESTSQEWGGVAAAAEGLTKALYQPRSGQDGPQQFQTLSVEQFWWGGWRKKAAWEPR